MKHLLPALFILPLLLAAPAGAAEPTTQVLRYHADTARTGNFVIPALTWQRARSIHRDPDFHTRFEGHVYAQPLFWNPKSGTGMIVVATENNTVYALNAKTGSTLWTKRLGRPVPRSALACGDISPLGITGTPVIDARQKSVFLDAMRIGADGKPEHVIFGLSLRDGSILPGWPIDVAAALKKEGIGFNTAYQNQRGALTIMGRRLYVPFGGHFGDCGNYHGWVIGIRLDAPHTVISWHTQANGGAVWAPAGISRDDRHLFVATGNTMDASRWGGGEAVIRLSPDLKFPGTPADYFAPSDWRQLDARDLDLGGVAPVLFDLPGKDGAKRVALALGKSGKAYLLNRDHLGGIGGALTSRTVSDSQIRAAAAAVPAAGGELVAFHGGGVGCPNSRGRGITVLKISATPPTIATAWCGAIEGGGAPMATTTNGSRNAIFWMVGAQGDDRLYGFRADNGERLFRSEALPGLQRFQTLIATPHHLYVAADNAVYAFTF